MRAWILAVLMLMVSVPAFAQTLTQAQKDTVKAAVLADQTAAACAAAADDQCVANWLNATASPAFVVWRTRVADYDMHAAYVWTEMDSLTQAKFNQLTLLLSLGYINPSVPNVRQGLSDIFTGAALANTRTALVALAKRNASVFEKLLATGTGTTGSPATMAVEGPISPGAVSNIIR